ncbi:hypothetical protein CEQ90_08120 [Lewinellaceae bacterium SD302]|nr:hypothetical protein CEQ90_08120 [Lewinellaceae bacterium SD302]
MNLSTRMAWRYLFAKKSTNAINIITMIAAFGVAVGAAALVLALSVFNGFEDLFLGMFDSLNPDVEITAAEGKTFKYVNAQKDRLYEIPGVKLVSSSLEETAFFTYRDRRSAGKIKGVDRDYVGLNQIDTSIRQGYFQLIDDAGERTTAVVGQQLGNALNIDVLNQFETLDIYMAKREKSRSVFSGGDLNSLVIKSVLPVGVVQAQQSFENDAVLIDIDLARDLLGFKVAVVSALEIKLAPGFDEPETYDRIREVMGPEFVIKNRLEQESGLLKLMRIERWVTFAIVALMMVLISFNMIGALWMIVLEKQKDISILRSMGMTGRDIRNVFLRVGLLLCVLGIAVGFSLAILFGWLQEHYVLIRIPGTLMEAYPLSLRWTDFPVVAAVVMAIGFLASVLPARRAQRIEAIIREE